MSTWVQWVEPHDVDLESIPACHNTIKVNDVNVNNDAKIAVHAINSSTNANARALKVEGKTQLSGDILINGEVQGLGGNMIQIMDEVHVNALFVGDTIHGVNHVTCDGYGDFDGDLTVGPANAAGQIDSGGVPQTPRDLEIGTRDMTADVTIGRAGQDVKVAEDLNVEGLLKVGPDNTPGKINSGGSAGTPQNLKVGTESVTADIHLCREGRTVDVFGQARMHGKAIILNDKASITADGARGIVDNPNGQNPGVGPSIDFYIDGDCAFYIDGNGGHNV